MKTILTVIGARPQFIKASVVSAAIARSAVLRETVIHTGQHHDTNMSEVFFLELGMRPPEYHLGIHGGSHGAMTGRMLAAIEEIILIRKPNAVMVYGDTNSTLAGALAAAKLHVPVAHVEAGLRSFAKYMPEEINRVLTDRISHWLFAPSEAARQNLMFEGADPNSIKLTGDVMYDAAIHHGSRLKETDLLARHGLEPNRFVLVTIHRAENTDDHDRLSVIVRSLAKVAESLPVVWPIHPRTRAALAHVERAASLTEGLKVIEPLGFLDMVRLERGAAVIATDSGGLQKEAFFYRIPCVTIRNETEWVELVQAGWNRLAPPDDPESMVATILGAIGTEGQTIEPYGGGDAARKIVNELASTSDW